VLRRRPALIGCLILTFWITAPSGSAAAFGTIDGAGQHREHERITRAALACAVGARSNGDCFEPGSMDQLAGHDKAFGGVGAPDSDEVSVPAAHCDDADYLGHSYPLTRDHATASLIECVDHLRTRFREGVESAKDLLDSKGLVVRDQVGLDSDCRVFENAEARAKCATIEAFGRALHGVQDFYSHSNWADEADPNHPIGPDNPPGLNMPGPSVLLDLRRRTAPRVPPEFTTGCFVLKDQVPGVAECAQRVTHAALNKDNGLIDPVTGATTGPTTRRGMVKENFAKAVTGAINETRRQWRDFRDELTSRYGRERAAVIVCALTRDDAVNDCKNPAELADELPDEGGSSRGAWVALPVVLVGVGVVLVAAVLLFRARRVRRAG
jgi:hypothetical protein